MPISELVESVQKRGDAAKIARYAGVAESTITRLLRNDSPNPGIETVAKIIKACDRLNVERAEADAEAKSSEKTDGTKIKSKTPSVKAGA